MRGRGLEISQHREADVDRRTLVGSTAAVSVIPLLSHAAFAQTVPKAKNVVRVHGLFADGSSWSEVIPRLQGIGTRTHDLAVAKSRQLIRRRSECLEYYDARPASSGADDEGSRSQGVWWSREPIS